MDVRVFAAAGADIADMMDEYLVVVGGRSQGRRKRGRGALQQTTKNLTFFFLIEFCCC
jgi:hypothetical protein